MKQTKAFTLVELLVVVAIIALLLGILLPSLTKAKETTVDVICQSNLKQWGTVWQIYTQENENKLPDATGAGMLRGDWIVALRENYPTGKMTQCPLAKEYVNYGDPNPDHGGVLTAYRNGLGGGEYEYCSDGMNNWSYSSTHWAMDYGGAPGQNIPGKDKIWKTLDADAYTNTIPLFMDSAFRGSFPSYGGYDSMNMPSAEYPDNGFDHVYDGVRQFAMPRHKAERSDAGINVLFFDLTVRPVKVKEIWTLKWHRGFDTQYWQSVRGSIWPGTWMDRFDDP